MHNRFIDKISASLMEFSDPTGAISLTKTVTEEPAKPDTVHATQVSHIAQQKQKLAKELETGLTTVKTHLENGNAKLARLALEALESLEDELRQLEIDEASLNDKQAEKSQEK